MDRIDRSILTALQDNARISNVDLAAHVGLSPSACLRRVALLEQNGVINGYHADLNAAKMGHDVLVLLHITLHGQSAEMMAEFGCAPLWACLKSCHEGPTRRHATSTLQA